MSDTSATWPLFGEYMLAQSTRSGAFEVLRPPATGGKVLPLDIRGRPIDPVPQEAEIETTLGGVRHKTPPPEVARVLSSLALVAALILSLIIQAFLGP